MITMAVTIQPYLAGTAGISASKVAIWKPNYNRLGTTQSVNRSRKLGLFFPCLIKPWRHIYFLSGFRLSNLLKPGGKQNHDNHHGHP